MTPHRSRLIALVVLLLPGFVLAQDAPEAPSAEVERALEAAPPVATSEVRGARRDKLRSKIERIKQSKLKMRKVAKRTGKRIKQMKRRVKHVELRLDRQLDRQDDAGGPRRGRQLRERSERGGQRRGRRASRDASRPAGVRRGR